jgi:signal transduction histidine kinase
MKTQAKIALLLVFCNLTILILFGLGVYFFQNEYSYVDFYKRLETRATIAAKYNLKLDSVNAEYFKAIREQHLEILDQEKEYVIEMQSQKNIEHLAKTHQVPAALLRTILNEGKSTAKNGTTLYAGVRYKVKGKRYAVIVSANNYYATHHLNFLRNILGVGVFFTSLITVGISIYFSRHIFDPIRKITNNVQQISTENIYLRLNEEEYQAEIGALVITFNDLLNRLETAFETQKNFISNASHELATPLTAIIGEADVTLKKERTSAEYQMSLQNILVQAERLDQITKSLLFLAQIGFKGKKIVFETVRMDEIIWEAKATLDRLNPKNEINVDLSFLPEDPRKLKINGNRQLLHLSLANLFNNACKYSHNKPVSVHIAATDHQVVIAIADKGVGIPADELKFIYDPFFRASNTHLFEGYGIGLPLARNIIKLHGGELNVSSTVNVGTTVQVKLPSKGLG